MHKIKLKMNFIQIKGIKFTEREADIIACILRLKG